MSRHKLIKNLDLDEELDDYDGGEDYEYDGVEAGVDELSEEDQENMRVGTLAVRLELPETASHITDKQIQDALWFYFYDIEKSVGYLVSTYGGVKKQKEVKEKEVKEKKNKEVRHHMDFEDSTTAPNTEGFDFKGFFKDMPWLNVPSDRETTFIAPLYPRGGLLGGSSDGAPKISKLQALAAARKKKAQEQKAGEGSGVENPMEKLSIDDGSRSSGTHHRKQTTDSPSGSKSSSRGFPLRKRKDSNPHEKPPKAPGIDRSQKPSEEDTPMETPPFDQAEPSAFANTMFSAPQTVLRQPSSSIFSLPYVTTSTPHLTSTDPFAGPSPDDVVIAAQSKASGKGGKGPPKTAKEKRMDQIEKGVEALKIDDTPRATSKGLDVLKEFEKAEKKNAANFVVIGHVDAGKSTLMGRLLADLNVIDARTLERYRKEATKIGKSSFALAWVLDQGTEERSRGVTIDIATNKFETDKTSFTILDAPGHRDFIPNMIAGASQADFAVLVVDAGTGNFESGLKGQTKEHALLVRSMGVQRLVIAVNKLDTVSWSEERFTEIENQVLGFLLAAGFQAKNISFIPCSGLLGENILKPIEDKQGGWYKGPTLIQALEDSEPVTRALTSPLRLTISDIFRGGIQNPLSISSRIEAGSLQTGDSLLVQPAGQKCWVKSIEIDEGTETVDWAVAGQNVILNLGGIEEQYLHIGDVLCSPSSPVKNVKEFTVKVLAFEFLMPMGVVVHRGRLSVAGRISRVVEIVSGGKGANGGGKGGKGKGGKEGEKKKSVKVVKPNMVARVQVELEKEVPLESGARVVLRSGGETVGAGLLE